MTRITKSDLKRVYELDLHDAEISDVICSYIHRSAQIPIILHCPGKENVRATLNFENTTHFSITFEEPWGAGFYINEVTTDANTNEGISDDFSVSILLNSGDRIEIITQTLTYQEDH